MQGKLEVNLDPAFIGFTSANSRRAFRYCQIEDVMKLLADLDLTPKEFPLKECIISLSGDYPSAVLLKHGLIKSIHLEKRKSPYLAS